MTFRNSLFAVVCGLFILNLILGVSSVFASLSDQTASSWSKFCADNPDVCSKNENPDSRNGSVTCPGSAQTISQILVHAGDGQDVSQLPDDKFSYTINGNTVTITALDGTHDLSWIMVVCTTETPPPPTDVCPNLEGDQADIPEGYELEGNNCVLSVDDPIPPLDLCSNLEGTQSAIPTGYHLEVNSCVLDPQDGGNSGGQSDGSNTNNGSSNNSSNSNSNSSGNSGQVLGAATSTGAVLGASTLAATGQGDNYQLLLLALGLITQSAGATLLLARNRLK